MPDGSRYELFAIPDGIRQGSAQSKITRDRRRKHATRAVGMPARDAFRAQVDEFLSIEKHVGGITFKVAAFHHDVSGSHSMDLQGGLFHIFDSCDLLSSDCLGFLEVRRDQ